MKKVSPVLVVSASLLVASCGGREAHPVMVTQTYDTSMECQQLKQEIAVAQSEMDRLEPYTSKTGKNVALGIAGLIIWPVWFFMDFKNAEKIEYNALRARKDHLTVLANQKGCNGNQAQPARQSPYQPVPQPQQPAPYYQQQPPQPQQPVPYYQQQPPQPQQPSPYGQQAPQAFGQRQPAQPQQPSPYYQPQPAPQQQRPAPQYQQPAPQYQQPAPYQAPAPDSGGGTETYSF